MTLKHCIIHHLERPAPGHDITTTFRDAENNPAGPIYSLFEQLKHSYQRSSQKQYGHFDKEISDNPIPGWIKEQQAGKAAFTTISQQMVSQLCVKLDETDEVFSAHLLIAIETVMDQDQLFLFWINHTEASHIDNDMEVASTAYVDGAKMQYAIKVLLDEWLEEETQKYLSIITGRGNKNLADTFNHFIGFASGVDLAEETNDFLSLVDRYAEDLPEDKIVEQKTKIIDYCVDQDKVGRPVVFEDISEQLDTSEPKRFANFLSEHQETPQAQIYTDRNSLKRYVRYFGRDKNMSISFSADLLGSGIIYDEQTKSLTIHQVPKSLRQQFQRNRAGVQKNSAAEEHHLEEME